jgi:hypothetical protein
MQACSGVHGALSYIQTPGDLFFLVVILVVAGIIIGLHIGVDDNAIRIRRFRTGGRLVEFFLLLFLFLLLLCHFFLAFFVIEVLFGQ